jgi:hypothetical protein
MKKQTFSCVGLPGCGALDCDRCGIPFECEWCEDTGERLFCPSWPDKCSGCEKMPCDWCNQRPREAQEPEEPLADEALAWGGVNR